MLQETWLRYWLYHSPQANSIDVYSPYNTNTFFSPPPGHNSSFGILATPPQPSYIDEGRQVMIDSSDPMHTSSSYNGHSYPAAYSYNAGYNPTPSS